MINQFLLLGLVMSLLLVTPLLADNHFICTNAPEDAVIDKNGCMIGDINNDHFVNAQDIIEIKSNPALLWQNLGEDLSELNKYLSGIKLNFGKGEEILTINVKDSVYGAKGDGTTDDGPAIQKALTAEPSKRRKIYFPEGKYFIDQTLIVSNKTEIFGEGQKTVLIRGPRSSYRPLWGASSGYYALEGDRCGKNYGMPSWELFTNSLYNCGNEQIYLHDFTIDGSKVVLQTDQGLKVYKQKPNKNEWYLDNWNSTAVTISFSAVKDTTIQNLFISNVPQDAIFIRNGGVNTIISDNVIDGFNMRWYNGGGINIEMHGKGNYPVDSQRPVRVENNTLIVRSPSYCVGSETKPCSMHGECAPSTCGVTKEQFPRSNIGGIIFTWIDGLSPPRAFISNNIITVTNLHTAISCHGCRDSTIQSNVIKSMDSKNILSGLFTGILSDHPKGGSGNNITIQSNIIKGSGRPHDGRAILLSRNDPHTARGVLRNNVITSKNGKNLGFSLPPVHLTGYNDFEITGNKITEIGAVSGLEIGAPNCEKVWEITENGIVNENTISLTPDNDILAPVLLRRVKNVKFENNVLFPDKGVTVIC